MTSIIYIKRYNSLPDQENAIILKSISGVGLSQVTVTLKDMPQGYISIGDIKSRLECGSAVLDLRSLRDGLYTPIVIVGTKLLLCSPIIKRGDVLIRPLPDGEDISRLEMIISGLEKWMADIDLRIARLESENTIKS